jgi:tetratricopeptide (TPR) repeat protein
MFAYGDALMALKPSNTNDPLANYAEAIKVFSSIARNYPSNSLAARAEGKIGDSYLQLARTDPRAFQSASNAYQRAMEGPNAEVTTRSLAEIGLAAVLEMQAAKEKSDSRSALLQNALDRYLNVFYEKNLRPGELPDPFMIKKSGWEAGRLAEALQAWPQALKLYERLQARIPALEPLLRNKILKAREQVEREKT